jgi:hypothetical protein
VWKDNGYLVKEVGCIPFRMGKFSRRSQERDDGFVARSAAPPRRMFILQFSVLTALPSGVRRGTAAPYRFLY